MQTALHISRYFVRLMLFWMLLFQWERLIFVLYHAGKIFAEPPGEVVGMLPHSLRLDFATACYLMGFPLVMICLQNIAWPKVWNMLLRIYGWLVILGISGIVIAELELYNEWGVKLNYKAIQYLAHPTEIWNTLSITQLFGMSMLYGIVACLSLWAFEKWGWQRNEQVSFQPLSSLVLLTIGAACIGFGLRGGWQQIPINQSESYYSKNADLNIAATNSLWNFGNSVYRNYNIPQDQNPYQYCPDEEAQSVIRALHATAKDTTIHILSEARPNVVLVILESWSADLVRQCGGDSGIVPEFERLCDSGYLFTKCYATGERSDQGMAAIWSAFPSQPTHSIISQPDKFHKLPSMVNNFKAAGYYTSFLFGGQHIYGNIKGYMMANHFDRIREGSDFSDYPEGRLGIHDQYMMDELLRQCNEAPQPFLNSLFTLSTHNPYDMPCSNPIQRGGDERRYLNSAYYTDSCIGVFMREAKKQPWYPHTLFVFVADHSHHTPQHKDMPPAAHHHIPMLWYGDVIRPEFRGHQHQRIVSQVDLAASLLTQLGMPHDELKWSRNIFNPYGQEFAYMVFSHEGVTWLRPWGELSVQHNDHDMLFNVQVRDSSDIPKLEREGRAYLQEVFRQYLQ